MGSEFEIVNMENTYVRLSDMAAACTALGIDAGRLYTAIQQVQRESAQLEHLQSAVRWIAARGGSVTARELLTGKVVGCKSTAEVEHLVQALVAANLATKTVTTAGNRKQTQITLR